MLFGCKKSETEVVDIGLKYYPTSADFYRIFQVDSIVFNDFTERVDTFQYFIKETIIGNYQVENETRTSVLDQKKRKLVDPFWLDNLSWSFQKDNFTVEENKNNTPKIVLIFPVKTGISWNSNTRNSLDQEEYTITNLKTETILGNTFNNVITIEKFNETDPLQLNTEIGEEKYAQDVGLIYLYEKRVKRFTTGEVTDIPLDSGFVLTKKIIEYGQQ
ncbi:MAG: hypothetical protein ACJASM_001683 [Salibacteraceae bacterium]|jgi:hypothetical protein|tara:strand:+ start:2480 stop:3130 length:651 start_codon:yes stop_codon:yes gene_type:complete